MSAIAAVAEIIGDLFGLLREVIAAAEAGNPLRADDVLEDEFRTTTRKAIADARARVKFGPDAVD